MPSANISWRCELLRFAVDFLWSRLRQMERVGRMHAMTEWDALQRRQLIESMARLIGDAADRAHRLGLLEVVDILREAQQAVTREASSRHDAIFSDRWQAAMH